MLVQQRALLLIGLVLTVAGCAGGGPAASAPPPLPVDVGAEGEGALRIVTSTGLRVGAAALAFEAATGCAVQVVDVPDVADLARRVPSLGADVLAVAGEDVATLVSAGAASPLPTGVGRPNDVIGPLRAAPIGTQVGRRYGLPYAWGPDLLLYRPASFPSGQPTAWEVLYDPAYVGLVVVPDSPFQIANAAVVLGASDPFAVAGADLAAARELLRHQRPLVRAYGLGAADLGPLFAEGRVVLAEADGATAKALAIDGVEATVPAGTTTGWSRWWLVAAGSRHPRCAAKWLNYAADPAVQVAIADEIDGSPASSRACALVGPTRCDAYWLSDAVLMSAIRIAHAPPSRADWETAWLAARR